MTTDVLMNVRVSMAIVTRGSYNEDFIDDRHVGSDDERDDE